MKGIGLHTLSFEWNDVEGADGYSITIGNQPAIEVMDNIFLADQLDENTEYDIEISVITNHRCPPPVAVSSCTTKECLSLEFAIDVPEMLCIEDEIAMVDLAVSVSGVEEGFTWSGENIDGFTFDPNGLAEGIYSLEVTHQEEDCINSEVVDIRLVAPPSVDMMYDEVVCFGEEFTSLAFSISQDSYTIFIDGEESDATTEISLGAHEVIIINSDMCATYKTIFIEESEEESISILGDLEIKEGDEHIYSIDQTEMTNLDINSIIWTVDGLEYCSGSECIFINLTLEEDSEIEVNGYSLDGCEITSMIRVLVEELEPKLVIPNIFSPNNDGMNDFWYVLKNKEDIKIENIKIVDRWNNLVYSQSGGSPNSEMKWDGRFNGNELQPGVYVYAVQFSADNNMETVYGDVTIVK